MDQQTNIPTNSVTNRPPITPIQGGKGVIIAIAIGVIALIIGLTAVMGYGAKGRYQGFIKKVEQQTEELKQAQPQTTSQPEQQTSNTNIPLPVSTAE